MDSLRNEGDKDADIPADKNKSVLLQPKIVRDMKSTSLTG
jgi:hypothetical protein